MLQLKRRRFSGLLFIKLKKQRPHISMHSIGIIRTIVDRDHKLTENKAPLEDETIDADRRRLLRGSVYVAPALVSLGLVAHARNAEGQITPPPTPSAPCDSFVCPP